MGQLNTLDYSLIGGYLVILLVIGFCLRKIASTSMDHYFLGGRSLPWWALGISGMAAWLDLTGTMLITSFLFLLGPTALMFEFRGGACLALAFMFIYIGKWHRRSGLMTNAEWMIFRFGDGFGGTFARLSAVIGAFVSTVGMLAYSIKGVGLFLSMFMPFTPTVCAAIMVVITCIYLVQSGFYGVVVTDVFQSFCILFGVIFVVIFTLMKTQGIDFSALATEVTGNPDWVRTLPTWKTEMPKGYEHYNYLTLVILFFFAKTIFQGLGAGVDNRYFGASGERECGLLGFTSGWSMVMRWPLMMGVAILGLLLVKDSFPDQSILSQAAVTVRTHFDQTAGGISANTWHEELTKLINRPGDYGTLPAQLEQLLGTEWRSKIALVSYQGTVFPERIMPAVLLSMIPTGIRGLIIVALLAAAMSTFNTMINTATSFFTRDLYQGYIRKHAGNAELIYVSWLFGVLLFAVSFVMAFYAPNINDIWAWLTSGLLAGVGASSILRLYWWRFNGGGFAASLLVGMVAAIAQRLYIPEMFEWYQFAYIFGVSFIACLLGTYMTPPTDRRVLEQFYIKTRPFGLWKPFETLLDEKTRQSTRREHWNDITAIPFGILWLITLNLLPMQMMVGQWRACAITAVLFVVSLAGLYVFWYRRLPPAANKA